tara:strand:+ start:89 stop:259 length:171 start_codon:yes stop_codon:yes gene_type:complete
MEKHSSSKEILLEKLKKIGDLSIINCSHPNDEINQNAKDINRLARDCFKLIQKQNN